MTNEELKKDLMSQWSDKKDLTRSDWEAIIAFVAHQAEKRMLCDFKFALVNNVGRVFCHASIQAENYDKALQKLGSAALPTFTEDTSSST